MKACKEEIVV